MYAAWCRQLGVGGLEQMYPHVGSESTYKGVRADFELCIAL